MYIRNWCDRVHFCNWCDQMQFRDRCESIFLHTCGHTKFVIYNDCVRLPLQSCYLCICFRTPLIQFRSQKVRFISMCRCYMKESCKENLAKSIITDFPRLADAQSSANGGTGYVSRPDVDFVVTNFALVNSLTNSITCLTFFLQAYLKLINLLNGIKASFPTITELNRFNLLFSALMLLFMWHQANLLVYF